MSIEADYITIGQHIDSVLNLKYDYKMYASLGRRFNSTLTDVNPRNTVKKLNFNMLGVEILKFAHECEDVKLTNPIIVQNGGAHCKAVVVHTDNVELLSNKPFYMQDMLRYSDFYVMLDGLESIKPGAGKELLYEVISAVSDIPIIIQAGYLYYGDYECLNEDPEMFYLPEKLCSIYEGFGFVNVNDDIGNYEDSIVMVNWNGYDYNSMRELLMVIDSYSISLPEFINLIYPIIPSIYKTNDKEVTVRRYWKCHSDVCIHYLESYTYNKKEADS